ncbi:hypothetical protein [Archangium violaceum]|uniref:Uncharacterized protein n=1 Tax=Archangium violaceum Cb vi76 TaxID=1406225 RepID=A0A084SQ28_9BACT|nr:hypothetical protein [Archangium violaceum]KFA90563.1 hypothetical protein Q664_27240 [Archangium violaceum Cb vi76]
MSRRISSRDDLFLSALDMYTLLSLAFIGFAFFVTPSSGAELADLPIAQGGTPTASKRLMARWAHGSAPRDAAVYPAAECQWQLVEVADDGSERVRSYTAGCLPLAFGGAVQVPQGVRRLHAELRQSRPEVVLLCRREDGLFACASLQWVMHEAGFRPLAGVASQQQGAAR